MRKSTITIMAILLVCFGTMLVAANVLSKPLQEDALLGKELTRQFEHQEVIHEGTKVTIVRLPASERTLAQEGRGVIVRLCPAEKIRQRMGGVNTLLRKVGREIRDAYRGSRIDWIEFRIESALLPDAEPFRTLVVRNADGLFGEPYPSLKTV